MRRPLFWICLFLSIVAMIHCCLSGTFERRKIWQRYFEEDSRQEQEVMFSGRIHKVERKNDHYNLWLKLEKNSWKVDSKIPGADAQTAAFSQRLFSYMQEMKTDRIRCEWEQREDGELPKIGSLITVKGRFSFLEEATNPGEFNFAAYYQSLGVGGTLRDTEILVCGEDYALVKDFLYRVREKWSQRLEKVFPEKEAGILQTMLLGEKSELDPALKELYRDGGILHILSISGLHVTLLGMGLFSLLRRLGVPQGIAAVAGSIVLASYGIMTGMSVSACRAIGMFLLRMLAVLWGRTYDLLTALSVLAASMLCTQPFYAAQSGFWLSFGALAGIGVVLPVLERIHGDEPGDLKAGESKLERSLREIAEGMEEGLLAGISVSLATLPFLLLFYYEVPAFSLLVNLLVIPLMGIVVGLGFLIMIIPGTGPLGYVVMLFLKWFEFLCTGVRKIPFSTWNPGCPRLWQMIVYYILLTAILTGIWNQKRMKNWIWKFILLTPCFVFLLPKGMDMVTFLDVGQGDCACLRTAEGQVWLSDCGSSSKKEVGEKTLLPFFKYEGIHRINGIFLSHADQDHVSGVVELLQKAEEEGIAIDALILPDWEEKRLEEEFSEVLCTARGLWSPSSYHLPFPFKADDTKEGRMQILKMGAGDQLTLGRVTFLAMHPQKQKKSVPWDANEESLCLLATLHKNTKEWKLLFTGDVEGAGEKELSGELKKIGCHSLEVLKCAHHGSKNATSNEFLGQVDAQLAVISCGRGNTYGHPHEETLSRLNGDGSSIFRTDQGGAIRIRFADNGQFFVKSFLE